MSSFFEKNFPFPLNDSWGMFAPYMDITAFILTIITTVILAVGVKESSRMNNFCTMVNLMSVLSKTDRYVFMQMSFVL